jgi:hypothetical protein
MSRNTKKVLSFDVGIINLAYCLMEFDFDTKKFTIQDWDIINMGDNRHYCPFVIRGGNICDKVAKMKTKANSDNIFYACKAHWNKSLHMVKPVDINWFKEDQLELENCCMCKKNKPGINTSNKIDGYYCDVHHKTISRKLGYLCEHKGCSDFITYGIYLKEPFELEDEIIINQKLKLGWCDTHYMSDYRDYIKRKTHKISQSANKIPLNLIAESMYTILDSKPEFLQVDEVLIENQPSLINPTMKSVAMILYSYFFMNCFHKRDLTKSTVTNLAYCSPSNKIKVGGKKVAAKLDIVKNTDNNTKNSREVYDITKDTGKSICCALIENNPKYLELYNAHKKKDDLADAFLQGFVMNFSEVPDYYANLLEKANITDKPKKTKTAKATKVVKTAKATKVVKPIKIKSQSSNKSIDSCDITFGK